MQHSTPIITVYKNSEYKESKALYCSIQIALKHYKCTQLPPPQFNKNPEYKELKALYTCVKCFNEAF